MEADRTDLTQLAKNRYELFLDRINRKANRAGCWSFTPVGKDTGKRVSNYGGVRAKTFAWQMLRGPIPEDHSLYNVCGQDWCVNPEHWACAKRGGDKKKMRPKPSPETVFWNRVNRYAHPQTGCWTYSPRGAYARKKVGYYKSMPAYVYAWQRKRGPVPEGHALFNQCGHDWCVNPAHWTCAKAGSLKLKMTRKGRPVQPDMTPEEQIAAHRQWLADHRAKVAARRAARLAARAGQHPAQVEPQQSSAE